MIEIRDISKKYRETFVLRHVSTRLPSNRMVASIGSKEHDAQHYQPPSGTHRRLCIH